ncbi:MAG: tetratricopeptide repeat protein [bacterium]
MAIKNKKKKVEKLATTDQTDERSMLLPPKHKSRRVGLIYSIILAVLVIVAACVMIDYYTAWGNTPKLIKRMLVEAEKKAIYKHYDEAETKYEIIMERFKNNVKYIEELKQAKLSLAKTLKDAEQYIKAIVLYKELSIEYKKSNPDMYAWLQLELADSYNSILNTEEAIRVYKQVAIDYKASDWSAEALFGIADAYKSKKDYTSALEYYDLIINKYEKGFLSAEALTNKGRIYEILGKIDLAYKVYEKVVREFPEIVTEYARGRYDALTIKTKSNARI